MKKLITLLLLCGNIVIAQSLMITEITDPQNSSDAGRYVEIYNPSADDIDLSSGYALQRWTNAAADPQSPVSLTGTIPAGGFYIVCNNADKFLTTYGMEANQDIGTGGAADSNGDDNIALLGPDGSIMDMFGVAGEDGTGTGHEFEDGRAERACGTSASTTWIEADWNVDNDSGGGDGNQYAPEGFDPFSWANDGNSCEVEASIEPQPCVASDECGDGFICQGGICVEGEEVVTENCNSISSNEITDTFGNGFAISFGENPDYSNSSYVVINDVVYYISFWYCQDPFMDSGVCDELDIYTSNSDGSQGEYVSTTDLGIMSSTANFFLTYEDAMCSIPILGCMDMTACNYSEAANSDDGSCTYPETNFDCDGNCTVDVDCAGVCGGTSVVDVCGECNGDGSSCSVDVTFSVDMSIEGVVGDIKVRTSTVNGEYLPSDWFVMDDSDGDMIYTYTMTLLTGVEYGYNFNNSDGSGYESGSNLEGVCAAGLYGNDRYLTTIEEDMILATVCWESCEECPTIIPGCIDQIALNYNISKTEIIRYMSSNKNRRKLFEENKKAQEMGIQGVPFFIFNNKIVVSGARPVEILQTALSKTFKLIDGKIPER